MPISIDTIRAVFFAEHEIWRDQLRDQLCAVLRAHDATIYLLTSELIDQLVDRATIEVFDPTNHLGLTKD